MQLPGGVLVISVNPGQPMINLANIAILAPSFVHLTNVYQWKMATKPFKSDLLNSICLYILWKKYIVVQMVPLLGQILPYESNMKVPHWLSVTC